MSNKDLNVNRITEHKRFMRKTGVVNILDVKHGDLITFPYEGEIKTVLVLEPKWLGKLHGLSLNALPRKKFIPILLTVPEIKSKLFYETKLKNSPIKEYQSYRTYFLNKVGTVHKVEYTI